jgi:hypothetical protein
VVRPLPLRGANGSITIAAGDSVGATPPISSFFGDTPTIELMNAMGFGFDGLGNHNFDRGEAYLRDTLIPLARFRYLSANVVDSDGHTPPSGARRRSSTLRRHKVGFIGFSNDDIPTLTRPTRSAVPRRQLHGGGQRRGGAAAGQGHHDDHRARTSGRDQGTLTNPAVRWWIWPTTSRRRCRDRRPHRLPGGVHRANGVLVTENRSKGIRFTGSAGGRHVAQDGRLQDCDFHKPWTSGSRRPGDPAADRPAQRQLAPILSTVIGSSTRFIPRTDACGNTAGRTCESLVGKRRHRRDAADVRRRLRRHELRRPARRADLPDHGQPERLLSVVHTTALPDQPWQVLTVLPFGNVVTTCR